MNREQAIAEYGNICEQYQDTDTHFIANIDPDLHPIRIDLPEPPAWFLIDGFGKKPKEQKWKVPQPPKQLQELMDKMEFADDIWDEIESHQHKYKESIAWIKKQWYHRLNGYWLFIKGKPTFIDGWQYFYCGFCKMDTGRLPEYRDHNRRMFHFARYCYTTTVAPRYKQREDKSRYIVRDKDGNILFKDYGQRVCYGFNIPKARRLGATFMILCILLEIGTRTAGARIGLQSYTGENAEDHFQNKLVPMFRNLPFFFKPLNDSSTNPKKEINCVSPARKNRDGKIINYKAKELRSIFDYADTAGRFYDGGKLYAYNGEELGKTKNVDIFERWDVVKECLSVGDKIHGFAAHPTTVEESDAISIGAYKRLCDQSSWEERDELTGRTFSGLFNYFCPAWDGREGFIDAYGESVIDKPTPEQARFIGKDYGAREEILSTLESLLKKGTPTAMRAYNKRLELYPTCWADCFRGSTTSLGLNTIVIKDRMAELGRLEGKDLPVRGNLSWSAGFGSDVVFTPDYEGRFLISKRPPDEIKNKRYFTEGVYYPSFPTKFMAGGDPYEFSKKTEAQMRESRDRMSDGGGTVIEMHDPIIDPPDKDTAEWQTYNITCTYRYRHAGTDKYCEDMLMMCIWYSCLMYPERNIRNLYKYFLDKGYGGYLCYDVENGKVNDEPGVHAVAQSNQERLNLIRDYIELHGMRCKHSDFLMECDRMKGIEQLKDFDIISAASCAFMGAKSPYPKSLLYFVGQSDTDYTFGSYFRRVR